MKRILFLLLLSLIATNSVIQANTTNRPSQLEVKLRTILKNVKKFKNEKNNKILTLSQKLEKLKQDFDNYKQSKEAEVQALKEELSQTKQIVQRAGNSDFKIKAPILLNSSQILTNEEHLDRAVNIAMEQAMETPLTTYSSEIEIVIK